MFCWWWVGYLRYYGRYYGVLGLRLVAVLVWVLYLVLYLGFVGVLFGMVSFCFAVGLGGFVWIGGCICVMGGF